MRVLVLGNGGREHALAWKISTSGMVDAVWMAPAASPKEPSIRLTNLDIMDASAIVRFCIEQHIGLVVIGPEAPLVAGVADALREAGLDVFGPTAQGARLEGSKVFAKEFMRRHGVPTAASHICHSPQEVREILQREAGPFVVKCDGLASGKGVCVTDSPSQAEVFASAIFAGVYGDHRHLLLEERLHGPELSIFALLDGTRYALLAPSRDHKRLCDGDVGPNTGGMGAFTPVAQYNEELDRTIRERVMDPIMRGLAAEGMDYRGLLYIGLMLTDAGPMVLEFNCRFGDPETQPLMLAMEDDLVRWLLGAARGCLPAGEPAFHPGAVLTVVLAAADYPGTPRTGDPISGLEHAALMHGVKVFRAGTGISGESTVVTGGRVLGVSAAGPDLESARRLAYEAVEGISFAGMQYRRDIGIRRE